MKSSLHRPQLPPRPPLTDRQRQILGLIMEGKKDSAIGAELGISYATVRNHVEALFRKFGVQCRVGLVRTWMQNDDTSEFAASETARQTKKQDRRE
jgi:DNA-binding NarL/FixJ family response regulator